MSSVGGAPVAVPAATASRWSQLIFVIICMMLIANLQYGWTHHRSQVVARSRSACSLIRAEIEANNAKVKQLADEQGWKVAQDVSAGVVGFVLWPVWFGMDFKDAAGKEAAALQARQQYLRAEIPGGRCVQSRRRQKGARPITAQTAASVRAEDKRP